MKKMYYEVGLTGAVDSDGVLGGGYNWEAGWDICHHFGFVVKWDSYRSSVWDSDIFWLQIVSRY